MSEQSLALLENFLSKYVNQKPTVRYFTRSHVFIAFRAFLSRTRPNHVVSMDFDMFGLQLEEVVKKINMKTKAMGKAIYYEFNIEENPSITSANTKQIEQHTEKDDAENIRLNDINIFLCCKLCCGYLVDATTITECLHSFCKSCIVRHLVLNKSCPVCGVLVHNTNAVSALKPDIVLQDIVNKLLPGIEKTEQTRFLEYQEATSDDTTDGKTVPLLQPYKTTVVYLEWIGSKSCTAKTKDLQHKYIRLPDFATVAHISQFVIDKLMPDRDLTVTKPVCRCDILCGGVVLPDFFTIEVLKEHGLDFEMKKGALHLQYDLKLKS